MNNHREKAYGHLLLQLTACFLLLSSRALWAICTLNSQSPSVTICAPASGATVSSPVHVVAGSTDIAHPVTLMQIYVDGSKVTERAANQIDTSVNMTAGQRRLTVQAKDSSGTLFKATEYITVSGNGLTKLQHIVFMLQENRSLDHYFGRMARYRLDRGYTGDFDGTPANVQLVDRAGHLIAPYHFRTVCTSGVSPAWNESHYDYHDGKMDRFMITTASVYTDLDPDGTRAMGYYDWTDIPYYYELAFQFATSDRFFSSVMSRTPPNRIFLYSATSFGVIRNGVPPFPGATIFDRLSQAGVSWRYYVYPNEDIFLASWNNWTANQTHVFPIEQYYADLQNGSLPSVAFIEKSGNLDEHPTKNVQKGAANTAKLINALISSSAWGSSAFILSYDEGGGWYDHVPPYVVPKPDSIPPNLRSTDLPGDFSLSGFRVPLIVVSPWVKPHFVSHKSRELTSITKLIEARFIGSQQQPMTARDAAADDMSEFFDFSNPYWLTPPPLPTQPTNGVCDATQQNAPGH